MPPWLYLALLISLLAALGYEITSGRSLRRVPLYWFVLLTLFLAAEGLAEYGRLDWIRLGELEIIPDTFGLAVGIGLLRIIRL